MIHVLAIFEDVVIDATFVDGEFVASFTDIVSGKTEIKTLTIVEFGATLALTTGIAEEDPKFASLYDVVKDLDFSSECRPYP